jgi:hypothetical protein
MGKKKSVGPDVIPRDILKLGGEAMIPYLARLLDITMNNTLFQLNGKKLHCSQDTKGKSMDSC